MNLLEPLRELGFNGRKAHLYQVLLRLRSGSATELARAAGLKRTTVYDLLDELAADGLAVISFAGRKRVYTALHPDNLQLRLERQRTLLDDLLPDLNLLFNQSPRKPRIRYYDGVQGVRQFHEELLQTPAKEYFYFGSMSSLVGVVGRRYLKSFVTKRVARKIRAHAIRIREQEIDESHLLPGDENYREVRYISLPPDEQVVNMTLYDDKVAIVASAEEGYALIIESHGLFTLLKVIWNYLWRSAEE
ncbi:MAG TPA: helix-turn-helix domain-containing protein [Chthoniobacteraceae bacterium]|nr:helix-turn-helix domain-containing protein [Chthoniobacteraceae bacterium]